MRAGREECIRWTRRTRVARSDARCVRTSIRRARFRALAVLAAALLLVAAFVPSAFAQSNTVPASGQPGTDCGSGTCSCAHRHSGPAARHFVRSRPPLRPRRLPKHSVAIAVLPREVSPWGMFLHADPLVKAVMVGLAFASLVTWTVWLAKSIELLARSGASRPARPHRVATLAQAQEQLRNGTSPVAKLMQAAANEIRLSAKLRGDGVKERIAWQLERIEAAGRKISRGTGVLATIGSTAPFVGLFGTVWGIMNSFIGISREHTTNLAVVAPGIAEALLATASGLPPRSRRS